MEVSCWWYIFQALFLKYFVFSIQTLSHEQSQHNLLELSGQAMLTMMPYFLKPMLQLWQADPCSLCTVPAADCFVQQGKQRAGWPLWHAFLLSSGSCWLCSALEDIRQESGTGLDKGGLSFYSCIHTVVAYTLLLRLFVLHSSHTSWLLPVLCCHSPNVLDSTGRFWGCHQAFESLMVPG